jgi:hypothetical protein
MNGWVRDYRLEEGEGVVSIVEKVRRKRSTHTRGRCCKMAVLAIRDLVNNAAEYWAKLTRDNDLFEENRVPNKWHTNYMRSIGYNKMKEHREI